jgi:diguanylate cyclase (GGDEF)-like protein
MGENMTDQPTNWKNIAEHEKKLRLSAEKSLEEMRRFLFEYFYLLGPNPKKNMSIVIETLGKVLGSTVALYNRMESGVLKTWCIDHEPEGFQREDSPEGHICYDMTICQRDKANISPVVLNDLEGTEWEVRDTNVSTYGLKSYLGFPIIVEDKVIGSVCVVDTEKRIFSDVEKYIIEAFASAIRLEEERLLTQDRLTAANKDLLRINEEMEQIAKTDQLTKLPNRRAMITTLNNNIATLHRNLFRPDKPKNVKGFSIAICDIDHFKEINDSYGHNCGDTVLKLVAETLAGTLRAKDQIARWGGEEFLIIFPETDTETATRAAERLREAISKLHFTHEDNSFQITITLGVSTCISKNKDLDACVNEADIALYEGKNNGRNQVVTAKPGC